MAVKTIEEILKAKGYTEQEIKDLGPMLESPKFRSALESEFSAMGVEVDRLTGLVSGDKDWYNNVYVGETLPLVERLQRENVGLRGEVAQSKEQLKAMSDYGINASANNAGKTAEQIKAEADAAAAAAKNPQTQDMSNYVDREGLVRTADMVGDAFTMAQDMAFEHLALFGTPLRNMTELRRKAKEESRPGRLVTVQNIWERDYKIPEKRDALKATEQAAHDKKIADDAVANFQSQQRNPQTRVVSSSMNPFQGSASSEAKPWLKSDAEKRSARLAIITQRKTA